jgi:uncharacterized Zn finger protein
MVANLSIRNLEESKSMAKNKNRMDRFSDLTWNNIEEWAGSKIVSRGKSYQRQGHVSDLAVTDDGNLIAWVDGTELYATRVTMDEDGLPESICTCPFELDCKHGVATVLEYLECIGNKRRVPKARKDDERLELLEDEDWDDELDEDEEALSEETRQNIGGFLKGKTKAQLIELIHELAEQYPEMARDLSDRKQLTSGNTKTLVTRLREEICDIGHEPGWQNHWNGEGYTPDYSGIRKKLETLLKAGHADEVLDLGRELVATGTRQVEESHDDGETQMEIADCMPTVVAALDKSSLEASDRLEWALDAVLKDQYEVCEAFAQYLHRRHPKHAWDTLADRLLGRLKGFKNAKGADNFSRSYERNRFSDWAIYALERAGREDEITPLCIAEAKQTASYDRLVQRLVAERCLDDAEHWIQEGIQATKEKLPGIASNLRGKLLEIRTAEKNWPVVAAMKVEGFVRRPSRHAFIECKKASGKAKVWPKVRESLLRYLEKGKLPWKQKGWPLPDSGLDRPGVNRRDRFPLVGDLVDIAIFEKKPDQVLKWYDLRPKDRFGWSGFDGDAVATAVQTHAPDRAVAIWKNKAERLIGQVKPSAYKAAAKYLRKAAKVMNREKKPAEWESYLKALREQHIRKRRLMEVLDGLEGKSIVHGRH